MSSNVRVICAAALSAVGAFLFGLDIGYIAPILECASFKRDVAHLKNWEDPRSEIPSATVGFIVGIFSLGCICTSFPVVSGYFLDCWGRRSSIMLGGAIFLVGCVIQALANAVWMMLVGRFVAGCSIGLLSTVVALYQSEVAPTDMRGSLTSLYQANITFGILVATVVDLFLVDTDGGWRIAIWLQVIPAGLLMVGMFFLPRSPRWLVQQDRLEEAQQVLLDLRGEASARQELAEIKANVDEARKLGEPRWAELFQGRLRNLLMLGVTLQLLQQFVGMNAFMYFGPRVFIGAGFRMKANIFQTILTAVNFAATFPALVLADRCGRRVLLCLGAAGMALACVVLGTLGGRTQSGSMADWLVTGMILFFVVNFAYSWGPIVWVYNAEIFPLKHRSRCMGCTTTANWAGNFVIAQFTPVLLDAIGFATFLIFAVFCLAGLVLAWWLPETKGVMLEHIDRLFDAKLGSYGSAEEQKRTTAA